MPRDLIALLLDESTSLSPSQLTEAFDLLPRRRLDELWCTEMPVATAARLLLHALDVGKESLDKAKELHDQLLVLDDPSEQHLVSQVCEKFWLADKRGAETLVLQLLPYLVIESLGKGPKRLYPMRAALLLLDFDDESIAPLKQMLLQCMMSPLFLRAPEGRRFLTYLFGLSPAFIDELHQAVRAQIPHCRAGLLEAYGDVYQRAWKASEGQFRLKLEYSVVQDLMHCAVHASQPALFRSLSKILKAFHDKKREKGMDEMLLRLYEPIVFRGVTAANATVREQALSLMAESFPLQNPDAPNAETDALLQRQFDVLSAALMDAQPKVRSVAVQAVSRVLSIYWELIPVATTKSLLGTLIGQLAHDAASSAVRVSVLQGLGFVLKNHLSHSALKVLLPSLQNMVHDKTEKVRVAFVSLLLQVKRVRDIRFFDVVPTEHLLARLRLDADVPAMTSRLTELFMSSYLPQDKSSANQTQRVMYMLNQDRGAALAFLRCCHKHAPLAAMVKLILNLKEQDELEAIAVVWDSIAPKLLEAKNETQRQLLEHAFSGNALLELLARYGDDVEKRAAVLSVAARLPGDDIPTLAEAIVPEIRMLAVDCADVELRPLVACLCGWGRISDVTDLVCEAVQEGIVGSAGDAGKRKRSKRSSVLPLAIALRMLQLLLEGADDLASARSRLLASEESVDRLADCLGLAQGVVTGEQNAAASPQDVAGCLQALLKLRLHQGMASTDSDENFAVPASVHELLQWATYAVFDAPAMEAEGEGEAAPAPAGFASPAQPPKGRRRRSLADASPAPDLESVELKAQAAAVFIAVASDCLLLGDVRAATQYAASWAAGAEEATMPHLCRLLVLLASRAPQSDGYRALFEAVATSDSPATSSCVAALTQVNARAGSLNPFVKSVLRLVLLELPGEVQPELPEGVAKKLMTPLLSSKAALKSTLALLSATLRDAGTTPERALPVLQLMSAAAPRARDDVTMALKQGSSENPQFEPVAEVADAVAELEDQLHQLAVASEQQ